MKIILALLIIATLPACATPGKPDPDYAAYLSAQQAQTATLKQEIQLVKIKAQPGQTITLGGVAEFTVSMPAPPTPGAQQHARAPNEWAGVVQTGLQVVGTVMGIRAAGNAAIGLAGAVGGVARTPQANITTTDNHATQSDSHNTDSHNTDNHASAQTPASKP